MLDAYQLGALRQLWIIAFPLAAVTITLAVFDTPRRGLRHWFVAAHPLSFLVAFAFALIRSPFTGEGQFQPELLVHQLLIAASLIGVIAANALYRGPRWIVGISLFTLICAAFFWVLGGMTITHDWM